MAHAKCNPAMSRERYPRSGLGVMLILIAFAAAAYAVFKNVLLGLAGQ
jgi:hypothetical protein